MIEVGRRRENGLVCGLMKAKRVMSILVLDIIEHAKKREEIESRQSFPPEIQ